VKKKGKDGKDKPVKMEVKVEKVQAHYVVVRETSFFEVRPWWQHVLGFVDKGCLENV